MGQRWLLIVWTAWGAIIAALVGWFDQNSLAALAWLVAGFIIGSLGPKLVGGLDTVVFGWYNSFWKDDVRDMRIVQLVHTMFESEEYKRLSDDEQRLEYMMELAPESAEYNRLVEEDSFGSILSMPLFVGLFHCIRLGGIVGALCPLDPSVRVPAWQGAAMGAVAGFFFVSFLAAFVFAVYLPVPNESSFSARLARRALIAVSPLLVVPIAWRCFTHLLPQRNTSHALPG
jgi:hypothetical protein